MRLIATIESARILAEGVWQGDLEGSNLPHKSVVVRRDLPTILVVQDPDFESGRGHLSFDYQGVEILNRGDDARALILAPERIALAGPQLSEGAPSGDRAFLAVLETLSPAIENAGRDLLERIRELDPHGELEHRGRRFINRPDNFVAFEPQTTLNQIIVHVRGLVTTRLRPVATQRGYSAFKISGPEDMLEAGGALSRATRKF